MVEQAHNLSSPPPLSQTQAVIKSMRPPFLILTPACIFLAFALARHVTADIDVVQLLLILLGALAAHISVNAFNEYFDFRSGLDLRTHKTPFSGGSGALPANPQALNAVLLLASLSLMVTMLIGLYFTYVYGLVILLIGVIGVLVMLTYTSWINKHPWLCLLAPGLGFGPLMVIGSYVILTGEWSVPALWISLLPFFLVNNLLLLNQFPDLQADRAAGRNHFPIAYGLNRSSRVYLLFIVCAVAVMVVGMLAGMLPWVAALALIPLAVALLIVPKIFQYAGQTDKLLPYLGINVMVTLTTPVLLGLALLWSASAG